MNKEEGISYLFTIANEIKRSYESPVVLLTLKDYADCIFNTLVDMRTALMQNAKPEQVSEIINTFHIAWLQAVQDIELFKKRAADTPRDMILRTVDYTMECVKKRHRYFQRYIEQVQTAMTLEERSQMQADIEIIGDLCEIVTYALVEKQKCLQLSADKIDFYVIVMNEADELLNWLDRLTDQLALQLTKVLHLKIPILPSDLVKTLQQIIDEVAICHSPETHKLAEAMVHKDKRRKSAIREKSLHGLEVSKIVEKIKSLEDRINRLKMEDSSAVMALEHKAMYLEERLKSLETLKLSFNCLTIQKTIFREDGTIDENDIHVFNHLLPHPDRCRLIERLVELWDCAIGGKRGKSIISILSAADIKEVFSDDLGHFTVDKYGRKIYTTANNDDDVYQVNERNELVPVHDDDQHVYFYDECGRYYLNETRERVYKCHETASEYLLHRAGFMIKVSDLENGVEFRYDNLGRYYLDGSGTRIYKDKESQDEYQHDGLGNLVRIRDENITVYQPCPSEPMVTNESRYLKQAVGAALKKCLAEVVMTQPPDPIMFLAESLEKYQRNIEQRQNRLRDQEEMMAERNRKAAEEPALSSCSQYEAEQSTIDLNFIDYETAI